jgi:hypothetical protein
MRALFSPLLTPYKPPDHCMHAHTHIIYTYLCLHPGLTSGCPNSPLTQEITAFVTVGGLAAVLAAVLLFAIGMGVGVSFVNALALAIGIFVAAALCGIPATVRTHTSIKNTYHFAAHV